MDDPEPKREGGRAARRASATHDRLLQASLAIFVSHGFEACAIEDITEEADVGKGTFYRHFRDKHAVLAVHLQSAVQLLEERISSLSPAPGTLADSIAAVARAHASACRDFSALLALMSQAQAMMATRKELYPALQPILNGYWDFLAKFMAPFLSPSIPPDVRRSHMAVLHGLISGGFLAGLSTTPSAAMASDTTETLCVALAPAIADQLRCAV